MGLRSWREGIANLCGFVDRVELPVEFPDTRDEFLGEEIRTKEFQDVKLYVWMAEVKYPLDRIKGRCLKDFGHIVIKRVVLGHGNFS